MMVAITDRELAIIRLLASHLPTCKPLRASRGGCGRLFTTQSFQDSANLLFCRILLAGRAPEHIT
jgi:hypothetical protein